MAQKKIKNLLEFKDREQVRGLLALASNQELGPEVNDLLLGYIKNDKWKLLGFFEGPILQALIGIVILPKKEAELQHLAVRPEDQGKTIEAELIDLAAEKLKFKKLTIKAEKKEPFESLGFEPSDVSENETIGTRFTLSKDFK